MKKKIQIFGIIFITAVIGFIFSSCELLCEHEWSDWKMTSETYPAKSKHTCSKCDEAEERDTQIGDTGHGGGKIFYISSSGFNVEGSSAAYYLEAANTDLGGKAWASTNDACKINISTETGIGKGRKNTASILAADSSAPAALVCTAYSGGGKNDWFLPSKDELNELIKQKSVLNLKANSWYRSSSQDDTTLNSGSYQHAHIQNYNGNSLTDWKNNANYLAHPIRAF